MKSFMLANDVPGSVLSISAKLQVLLFPGHDLCIPI